MRHSVKFMLMTASMLLAMCTFCACSSDDDDNDNDNDKPTGIVKSAQAYISFNADQPLLDWMDAEITYIENGKVCTRKAESLPIQFTSTLYNFPGSIGGSIKFTVKEGVTLPQSKINLKSSVEVQVQSLDTNGQFIAYKKDGNNITLKDSDLEKLIEYYTQTPIEYYFKLTEKGKFETEE